MKKLLILSLFLVALTAGAQTKEKNPKDLWTRSVDVSLGDDWKQKTITVPGKGTPNVIDFFRAFAKAYPCEYHDLLLQYLDGDKEVLFCGERPWKRIDKDFCFLQNESFSMRVFYENDKPAALGVCCHKAITTELQEAYYFRYNAATRKLTPLAKGSDFTGGIVKRRTVFSEYKKENEATMHHVWGRCGVQNKLVWGKGKFELKDTTKEDTKLTFGRKSAESMLQEVLSRYEMELRDPHPVVESEDGIEICGGSYTSLPVCIAIRDPKTATDHYVTASAMEGFYYFTARSWERADGSLLVAVYTECAPRMDYYKYKDENGNYVHKPHKLEAGDEVELSFYVCNDNGMALYLDPASPRFASMVGKGLPSLVHNEWRCEITPDNEDLTFVRESDGLRKVFQWNGKLLKAQD